jgi:hypothetical protein
LVSDTGLVMEDSMDNSRRQLCAAASLGALGCGCATPGRAPRQSGCTVSPQLLAARLSQAGVQLRHLDVGDPTVASSGIDGFDRALGRQLVRLATTFGVQPGFAYVDDGWQPNAIASSLSRFPGTWGTVLMGIRLMRSLMARGDGGDIAVLGVCAHEFGHVAQYRSASFERLLQAHPTVKLVELHADFMAGYFIGTLRRQRPAIVTRTFELAFQALGTNNSADPDFHGTPDERLAAVQAGQAMADRGASFATCKSEGERHVLARFI